jgi:hypothetical protein
MELLQETLEAPGVAALLVALGVGRAEEPRGGEADHFTDVKNVLYLQLDAAAEQAAEAPAAQAELALDLALGDVGELDRSR